jgi:hypothetical protein
MGEMQWIMPVGQALSTLGLFGVVGWVMYWYPKWRKEDRESAERVATAHETAIKTVSNTGKIAAEGIAKAHEAAIEKIAKGNEASIDRIVDVFREEQKEERSTCERRYQDSQERRERHHTEIVEKLSLMERCLRETKHSLADLLQTKMMNQAREEMEERTGKRGPRSGQRVIQDPSKEEK